VIRVSASTDFTALVSAAVLGFVVRERRAQVLSLAVVAATIGPIAWNAILRATHASRFFTDAPIPGAPPAPLASPQVSDAIEDQGGRTWWRELLVLTVAYEVYRTLRIVATGSRAAALAHAEDLIRLERALGVWRELGVHRAVARRPVLMHAFEIYYGTIHFVVPAVALVILFRSSPERYRHWRNVFGWMLVVGLLVFAVYPLMPPHLLPPAFGFGDGGAEVLPHVPVWSWAADNPYAAMPSLHVGWATWCALALWRRVPNRLWRGALLVYPLVTLLVVVGTANHYVLDGVGGWLALATACGIERLRRRWTRRNLLRDAP